MAGKPSHVTIRDIARQAGVSVATVSRYINGSAPVSPQVAERLGRVMAATRYVPLAAARDLASRRTRMIGLLVSHLDNDFFAPLLAGIEGVVQAEAYNLLVATSRPRREHAAPAIGPHNTDGMIVFADSLSDEELASVHGSGFPLVLVHRTPPASLPIPFVTVENKRATQSIVDHLIDVHGKRDILFLRGPAQQEDAYWREVGYRASLEGHRIPFQSSLMLNGEFEREIAHHAVRDFLADGHPPFDAIFAGDDHAATGVIQALRDKGLRVPEDFPVVGFDDQSLSAFVAPPLTTVRAPTREVGRVAARQLFNLLVDRPVEREILLPTEIVIRRSCGCPYGEPAQGRGGEPAERPGIGRPST